MTDGNASQKLSGTELVLTLDDPNQPLGWVGVDITDFLQSDLDNQRAWSCFSFNHDATGVYDNRSSGFSFSSGDSDNAPYVEYTLPEPATMALLALGGVALLRRRRST